jgi:creatine kinase
MRFSTFGDLDNLGFGDLDPDNNMIVSTRVRVGRSHDGFSFPPCSNKETRVEMFNKTKKATDTLEGELKGTMYPLF